ncbi:MAG TPA: carboxypeptidase-like regulatory domain-containing protein [Perlabentimonas sp.]|nr:carboxypeptidase-like regulatory domain-containing protein [Bacteroidales bacterium]MDY0348226.1 carboxypeptidase-like regulatory domain-containing protein [Tenuifilaceae bacterium]HZJ73265.1 carboxypeptidase-like regulatory domain-containing protein [Perlabentimonas sp.]
MKTIANYFRKVGIIALLMLTISPIMSQNGNGYITINGTLKDAKTNREIYFAYITIPDLHIGTVSNNDGEFTLKISNKILVNEVEFSHIGYKTKRVPLKNLIDKDNVITLEPSSVMVGEVTIRPLDPYEIVAEALRKVQYNYSENPNMLTGFYRETIKQRRNYISISEALVDIYKTSYKPFGGADRVKILKGRKSTNVKKADTLVVKLQGGPRILLMLDIAKNFEEFFYEDFENYYNLTLEDMVAIEDKISYVISFVQKPEIIYPLYYGKLYIDTKNLAITHAQFSINLNNVEEATRLFVRKKPRGVKFEVTNTSYLATYTEHNGRYYLSYLRNELAFKANWKRRIFNTNYDIVSEMAITDRDLENAVKFPLKESFRMSEVLAETVEAFNDEDFWGEHNYIRPEESIQSAIKRYGRKLMRQQK